METHDSNSPTTLNTVVLTYTTHTQSVTFDPSGKSQEGENGQMQSNEEIFNDISFGIGVETTMVSIAAEGNTLQIVKTIGKTANVFGGVIGAIDNSYQSYKAFSNDNYIEGTYQAAQALTYTIGTIMLFTPLAPIGSVIILGTGIIDLGEYFYSKN